MTREEQYLSAIAGNGVAPSKPLTRKEKYLQAVLDSVESESPSVLREQLETVFVVNDHNSTGSSIDKRDYTYTEQTVATHGYPSYAGTVGKPGNLAGGVLRVDYDAEEVEGGKLQLSLFLFDADGNPYKHTGYGDSATGAKYFGDDDVGFIGELYEPVYVDPAPADNPAVVNAGYSFGDLLGPFSTQIPEGCTVMPFLRCTSFPCGNIATFTELCEWIAGGGITFTVEKKNKVVRVSDVEAMIAAYLSN